MSRPPRDPLIRVKDRPTPDFWDADEVMTLVEAAAVFFPDGLLTIASLRSEIRKGNLAYSVVAGKFLTTPRAMREMLAPVCRPQTQSSAAAEAKNMSTEAGKAAQAAGLKRLDELLKLSQSTSARNNKRVR